MAYRGASEEAAWQQANLNPDRTLANVGLITAKRLLDDPGFIASHLLMITA